MSTEERKEGTGRGEELSVPLYFDRYVASELRALGQRIIDLKGIMDERFAHMDERFAYMDERFVALKESMDERFAQVDKRFDKVDKRFDKLESTLKWAVGLFVPVIAGILAIIIKMFFSGKLAP